MNVATKKKIVILCCSGSFCKLEESSELTSLLSASGLMWNKAAVMGVFEKVESKVLFRTYI
jgi:hypothetical protein